MRRFVVNEMELVTIWLELLLSVLLLLILISLLFFLIPEPFDDRELLVSCVGGAGIKK
jgi:hypothetical protein